MSVDIGKKVPLVVHLVMAARPNFMKVAPLYHALRKEEWCQPVLIHTGQHYDDAMSGSFLRDLRLPGVDIHLGVGSGTHAEQTAGVMIAYEKICLQSRPDWVIVVGDVNSTLACCISAKKLGLPVAHLEAGLRSGDRSMPEEINRILTDSIADLLWTPSMDADDNLRCEGVAPETVVRVGNIMMDSFEMMRPQIEITAERNQDLPRNGYGVITLHRPSNVDDKSTLSNIIDTLLSVTRDIPLFFPVHPRTRCRLLEFGLWDALSNAAGVSLLSPLGYVEFMGLVLKSTFVITDSGGIQEETTYLGIPCLTLRENTERPITVEQGTNRLVNPISLRASLDEVLAGNWPKGRCPELWDGATAGRVVSSLAKAAGI